MKYYYLLSVCCFLALGQSLPAQVNQELENKYWTYRDRYRNYFTKIGGEAGESQSAASINQLSAKSLKFKIKNKQEVATGQENNYLMAVDYADAVIDQGWYMMVLASEYWLLKNKNQMHTDAYKALCNELYFAINAIERLDGNAERIFDRKSQPDLNGFFVRSDHQPDYLNGLNNVNVPLNPIQWLKSGGMTGPEFSFIDSSNGLRVYDQDSFRIDINNTNNRCSWQGGPGYLGAHQNWGNEMSQDQLYGLLMGFKSIMNWVDADLTVDPDGALTRFSNKNLHQWIKTITHRIMLHVSKTHKGLFGVADQDDLKADAEDACATISNKPYYRADTTGSDTLVTYIRDSTNNQIIDSIIDIVYFVRDTAAAAWFPGSKFRTCDVWQKLEELKAGNYLFKEANYIITNPANGDNLVTRGAVATPFAYALKSLGESITGNTYPEPFMKLRDNYQVYRWGLNAAWVAKMIAIYTASGATTGWSAAKITRWNQFVALSSKMPAVLTALNIAIPIALSLKDDWEKALDIYNAVTSGCPMAAPSPDLYAFCILQHSLNFKGSGMYKALWDRFPESNILKVGTFETIPLNLMNNLAVASGKWSHQTYADWCTYHGYEYNEILYAMMNDKKPLKPKQHYETALIKAQCEGNYSFGDPDNLYAVKKEEIYKPFVVDNLFTRRFVNNYSHYVGAAEHRDGTDYMLLYNLYEMANVLHWGGQNNAPSVNKQCPCRQDTIYSRGNLVNSTFDTENNWASFSYGSRKIKGQEGIYGLKVKPISNDTVSPHYEYYKNYYVRTPAYLLHNLSITGTQTQTNTISVAQDYRICNAKVNINNYATLKSLPNINVSFPSLIEVSQNSILELNAGGSVVLENNTQLVIEPGGTLKYSNGARIILNGPNAVLYIKGKLELAPGASFQIEGGPAGKGYVVWDCGDGSPHYGRASLQAGAGSKMVFKQNDNNKLALEVRGFSGMYLPHTLQSFTADSCRINLKEQALIVSNAQFARFKDADVYGHNEAHRNPEFNFKPSSRGIQIWGRKNEFSNVTIRDCYEAIRLFNVGGDNQPLKLKNVKLVNNQVGVVNVGGSINWDGGEIIDANDYAGTPTQLRTGISGIGTHGVSLLKNVTMSVNDFYWMDASKVRFKAPANTAISNIWSHGPGRYYLTKCKAEYGRYGCIMNESFLFPLCSEFTENNTAIFLIKRSLMNAEGNAWNRFSWHPPDLDRQFIRGEDGVFIYLDQGKNYIKGYNNLNNNTFFMAHINQTQRLAPSDGISGFNTQAILARGNQWAIGGASHNLFTGLRPGNDACVSLAKISIRPSVSIKFIDLNYSPQYSGPNWDMDKNTACAAVNGPITNWPLDLGVSTTIKNNGKLGERVLFIADSLKKEFDRPLMNYPELIRKATDFLVLPFPTEVGGAVYELYSRLHATYPLAFTDTTIPDKNRQTILAAVQREMNTLQDKLIHLADGSEPIMWTEFRYEVHRDKALIQRVFNQRSQALLHLNNKIPSFSRPEDVKGLQAWRCLIEKEQAWLDSLIPYWMVSFDTCLMNFDSMGNWDSTYSDHWTPDWIHHHRGGNLWGNNEGNAPPPQAPPVEQVNQTAFEISIRPNPTEGLIALSMTEEPLSVELMNVQGQSILHVSRAAPEMELNIGGFPDGLYFIRVLHTHGIKTIKIIKRTN